MSISIHLRLNLSNVIINITKILSQGMYSKIKRVYSKMLVIKVNDLLIFKGAYESIKYKFIFQHFTVNSDHLLVYFHNQNNFR